MNHTLGIWDRAAGLVLAGTMAVIFLAPLAKGREIPAEETKAIQSRLGAVASPDATGLAKALGIEAASAEPPPDVTQNYLQALGELGSSKYLLQWTAQEAPGATENAEPEWALFLLEWADSRWQVLPLMGGYEPFVYQVLPAVKRGERLIAVTVFAGASRIPFPTVFRLRGHAATMVWDGRSDESLYQGYDQGRLQFGVANGALQMIAEGRADPGLLVFPKTGRRGFDVQSIYKWTGEAFDPIKTEYTANRDFTLYRFIAALHLHDFHTAYSLIDPAKFLRTDKPSPEAFRKMMEDRFPEFLDDQIFNAPESGAAENPFQLNLADKVYVYAPSFSGTTHFLLSGLERQEHKPEAE